MDVGERGQLKGREAKDISNRKNSFREKVEMQEYGKHVWEMADRRFLSKARGSTGWRNAAEDKLYFKGLSDSAL